MSTFRHNVLLSACLQIDGKKYDQSAAYLKLPQVLQDVENKTMIGQTAPPSNKQRSIQTGAFSLNMADSFQIHTLVCSTKLTHNGERSQLKRYVCANVIFFVYFAAYACTLHVITCTCTCMCDVFSGSDGFVEMAQQSSTAEAEPRTLHARRWR